jgi:hypothetical protein
MATKSRDELEEVIDRYGARRRLEDLLLILYQILRRLQALEK